MQHRREDIREFLGSRGFKNAAKESPDTTVWKCDSTSTCIAFRNAKPRTAAGKLLSRSEVAKGFLQDPSSVDFGPKYLGQGYWAIANQNFVMGASMRTEERSKGCSVTLNMGFGLGGMNVLVVLPYDLYNWPIPPDNGRLQRKYISAMVEKLPVNRNAR